jgi:DNA ligase (NAD+)
MSLTASPASSYYNSLMGKKTDARIGELEGLIRRHQDLYYNGQPEISDAEFDELWDELSRLDPGNAVFEAVGADAADGWLKARHLMPMGSQEKASNPEDFLAWCAKVAHPEYIVQYKLDGASLELQYEAGALAKAVTRGDGEVGDDITPNASRMRGVVTRLPVHFSGGIRGEVLMSHAVHSSKYADKANCRNAANGLMKRKDGSGSEDLEVVCYDASGSLADGG